MNNYTTQIENNQEKDKSFYLRDIDPSISFIDSVRNACPTTVGNGHNKVSGQIINILLALCPNPQSTTKQTKKQLCAMIGKKRTVINDHVRSLVKLGLVTVSRSRISEGKNRPNIYQLHPMFYDHTVRSVFSHRFPNMDELIAIRCVESMKRNGLYRIMSNLLPGGTTSVHELWDYANEELYQESFDREEINSIRQSLLRSNERYIKKTDPLYICNYTRMYATSEKNPRADKDTKLDWTGNGLKEMDMGTINGNLDDLFLIPDQSNLNTSTKKEVTMTQYNLKSIKPTQWGQIRLNAFPEEVVSQIDSRIHSMKSRPDKPWQYFVSSCKQYCEKNGLDIDWTGMFRLATEQGMPDQGPFIDESFIPVPKPDQTRKTDKDKSGVDWNKARANEEWLVQFGIERMAVQSLRKRKEMEEWLTDPVYGAARKSAEIALRQSLGMDENGVFINQQAQSQAVHNLLSGEEYDGTYSDSVAGVYLDNFGDRVVTEPYTWSEQSKSYFAWFINNLNNLPDEYDITYKMVKQIMASQPSASQENIAIEVISNLKEILDGKEAED